MSNDTVGFWRPADVDIADTAAAATATNQQQEQQPTFFNYSNAPIVQQRRLLPIYTFRSRILYSLEKFGVVVVVGETACGKSTQIPQYLMENGWCGDGFQVVCTQPRRLAAQTLAKRVAQEVSASSSMSSSSSSRNSSVVGGTVGYSVRFDDRSSDSTRILFVTDGILLREATLKDPLLSSYSVVMVDEAHERSLGVDSLLGLLKKIRRKRPTLRVIICSATIDAKKFLDFFCGSGSKSRSDYDYAKVKDTNKNNNDSTIIDRPTKRQRQRRWDNNTSSSNITRTKSEQKQSQEEEKPDLHGGIIISVDGRQHPVDLLYLQRPTSNYVRSVVETAIQICKRDIMATRKKGGGGRDGGDILCFLPSERDVDDAIRMAQEHVESYEPSLVQTMAFLPLYARLPYKLQSRVFRTDGNNDNSTSNTYKKNTQRRVIFSTNIAETSVTVPQITYVIDCGFVKQSYFDPHTGFERLITVPTSKASAIQRSGRAGRIEAGQCYRLYTEEYYRQSMTDTTPPEILRTNLTGLILNLKALGIRNILGFDMMDVPSIDALAHGLETLYVLGAVDDRTDLTQLGLDMSSFPAEPRVSRMLIESLREECSYEVAAVAGALQVRSLFVSPRRGGGQGGISREQQRLDYEAAVDELIDTSGDHVTYANVVEQQQDHRWDREECRERYIDYVSLQRVKEIRDQLVGFLKKFGRVKSMDMATTGSEERTRAILKCVTAGFFFNVARLRNDGRYYTLRGAGGSHDNNHQILVTPSPNLSIFPSHGSHSEYIIFSETHDGPRGGIELSGVSGIDPRWLRALAPPNYWK